MSEETEEVSGDLYCPKHGRQTAGIQVVNSVSYCGACYQAMVEASCERLGPRDAIHEPAVENQSWET